jgi:hypothetical protein
MKRERNEGVKGMGTMSVWVNDVLEKYAQQIHELMKQRFLDDEDVAFFYDKIEYDEDGPFHVDFIGLPYVTTVILYGLDAVEGELIVKIVDNKGVSTFTFHLSENKKKAEVKAP